MASWVLSKCGLKPLPRFYAKPRTGQVFLNSNPLKNFSPQKKNMKNTTNKKDKSALRAVRKSFKMQKKSIKKKTKDKSALRAVRKSFKMQKESIKRKTKELSEICNVKACAVIVGPDGTIDTWPKNSNDVREVIQAYKNSGLVEEQPQEPDGDNDVTKESVSIVPENFTKEEMLRMIDAKLAKVRKRIQFLKSKDASG